MSRFVMVLRPGARTGVTSSTVAGFKEAMRDPDGVDGVSGAGSGLGGAGSELGGAGSWVGNTGACSSSGDRCSGLARTGWSGAVAGLDGAGSGRAWVGWSGAGAGLAGAAGLLVSCINNSNIKYCYNKYCYKNLCSAYRRLCFSILAQLICIVKAAFSSHAGVYFALAL